VQGVLGEEFNKHYETPKDCTASGGHELSWKIFPAVSRKSGQEVSIFVFDKDELISTRTRSTRSASSRCSARR
jgi:SCY1-like protein 2